MNTQEQPAADGRALSDGLGATRPMRLQLTPSGVAAVFFLKHGCGHVGSLAHQELTNLFEEYWRGGWDARDRGEPCA